MIQFICSAVLLVVFSTASYAQPGIPTLPGKPGSKTLQKAGSKSGTKTSGAQSPLRSASPKSGKITSAPVVQRVHFISNVSCILFINGEQKTMLTAGVPFAIDLSGGNYPVQAVNSEYVTDTLQLSLTVVTPPGEKWVEIDLKQIAAKRLQLAAELCAEAKRFQNEKSTGLGYSRKSFELYFKAANLGSVEAMMALASLYEKCNGLVPAPNAGIRFIDNAPKLASDWYHKAARTGNADAMFWLGKMYNGDNLYFTNSRNHATAMEWFLKAAELGNADAMNAIGLMYIYGKGVVTDQRKAMDWFLLAARAGARHQFALYMLGYYYQTGSTGLPVDYQKAMEWYLQAAEIGSQSAMYSIGVLYESGLGVKKDRRVARQWFKKSCDAGFKEACDRFLLRGF